MRAYEHFLEYIKINTQSDEENPDCPSTGTQTEMARLLVKELRKAGADKAEMDENGSLCSSMVSGV